MSESRSHSKRMEERYCSYLALRNWAKLRPKWYRFLVFRKWVELAPIPLDID